MFTLSAATSTTLCPLSLGQARSPSSLRCFLSVAALLFLAGCASPAPTDWDQEPARAIKVVWHRINPAEAWRVCGSFGGPIVLSRSGCQIWRGDECHVYAADPPLGKDRTYTAGQWGTLGHELKHCYDGSFHSTDRVDFSHTRKWRRTP